MRIDVQKNEMTQRFVFSHSYCCYLNNILTELIINLAGPAAFEYEIEISADPDHQAFASLPSYQHVYWLWSRGHKAPCILSLKAIVLQNLLPDIQQFVYAGLESSRNGYMTVAYATLRKPFQDNLFYLEWLLGDPESFADAFMAEGEQLTPVKNLSVERRKAIIAESIAMVDHANFYNPETFYNLRFDKSSTYGFAGYWDQSVHLVTSHPPIRTPPQDFNFVGLSVEEIELLWKVLGD